MSGIYIHIPFCRQACHYCNFHFSTSLRKKDALLNALAKEIELCEKSGEVVETVYFGGGTPSILETGEIDDLLKKIHRNYTVAAGAEITLETNPDDITREKLIAWKVSGVNRLSIGIQSFFEEDLRWMNRAHSAEQAVENLKLAREYFENITIDLIYGVPGLSNEKWKQNIETAIQLNIPHLSCYALTVESKTPLDKLIRTNKKADVDAGQQSEQFLLLMKWAREAGYEHYEISNFAKPGYRSRHNSSYWQRKHYIGLGPAAHSYNGVERTWNVANNQKYIDAIAKGIIPQEKEMLTETQRFNEYIMTALRTIEGIDLTLLDEESRPYIAGVAQKYIRQELITLNDDKLQLTDKGKLFADGIASDLFRD